MLVLRGEDGLDEFTTTAPTMVWAVSGGAVTPVTLDAADLGLPRATAADLRGGDAAVNADVARRVFAGETGPVRDAVLVNAAAALVAYDRLDVADDGITAEELTKALGTALERAAAAVDSGAAAAALTRWVEVGQALRPVTGP